MVGVLHLPPSAARRRDPGFDGVLAELKHDEFLIGNEESVPCSGLVAVSCYLL